MPDASSMLAIAIGAVLGILIVLVWAFIQRLSQRGNRPVGVTIIAAFQLGVGALLLLILLAMVVALAMGMDSKELGKHPGGVVATALTMSLTSLLGGWGLWRGTMWGWHFAIFAIACGVARNLLCLLLDVGPLERQGATFFYTQHVGRAGFNLLMLAYLYRSSVFDYCSLCLSRMASARSLAVSVVLSFALEIGVLVLNR